MTDTQEMHEYLSKCSFTQLLQVPDVLCRELLGSSAGLGVEGTKLHRLAWLAVGAVVVAAACWAWTTSLTEAYDGQQYGESQGNGDGGDEDEH